MCLIWLLSLIGHLYVSGMLFDVAPKMVTKKDVLKKIGLCPQNMIIILGSIVYYVYIGGTYMIT